MVVCKPLAVTWAGPLGLGYFMELHMLTVCVHAEERPLWPCKVGCSIPILLNMASCLAQKHTNTCLPPALCCSQPPRHCYSPQDTFGYRE